MPTARRVGSVPVDEALLPTAADFQEMREAMEAVASDPAHFEEFAAKNAKMVREFPGWSDELRSLARQPRHQGPDVSGPGTREKPGHMSAKRRHVERKKVPLGLVSAMVAAY